MDVEPVVVDVPMVPVATESGEPPAMPEAPPAREVFLVPEEPPGAPVAPPVQEVFLVPEAPEEQTRVDVSGSTAMDVEP